MNLGETLFSLTRRLGTVAGEDAAREARLLLGHAMGMPPAELSVVRGEALPDAKRRAIEDMLSRRLAHEPLQYILGEWEFMGLPFFVESGALIPRPDTETLVEYALSLIKERGYTSALDLCCGSGCIGISLCKLAGIAVMSTDISSDCLAIARRNACRIGVRPDFCESDYFSALGDARFDMILSNPPYIRTAELSTLAPELLFEPRLALDGGIDGLDAYRAISAGYKRHLNHGGILLMEVGAGQAGEAAALFGKDVYTVKDLNGIDRVVCVEGGGRSIKERPYDR